NIVLGDEINRASPKTQSALLEAMEEHQVTVDARTYKLPAPFMVIATQNPIEHEGTYPLPESQVDRFLMRAHMGYPGRHAEITLLARPVLSHRLALAPDAQVGGLGAEDALDEILASVPVPTGRAAQA